MHEMSLVHDVVDVVLDECAKHGITRVKNVYLTVGEGRDIVIDLLDALFRHLARGTVAAEAHIVVNRVPLTMRCRSCGAIFTLDIYDESTWACPTCKDAKNYAPHTGLEFSIDRIEAA